MQKIIQFYFLLVGTCITASVYADFEMSVTVSGNPSDSCPFHLENRQDHYYWNNDVFEVMAFGFSTTSNIQSPSGSLPSASDTNGIPAYRWQVPRGQINYIPGDSIINLGLDSSQLKMALQGNAQLPLFPHIVIKEAPWFGLKYPDTEKYAPPLSYTGIDSLTGAVIGQGDYYDSAAWIARNDAPLMVDTLHHPTQLWIGITRMPPGTKVEDAADPAHYHDAFTIGQIDSSGFGYFFSPNAPDGNGWLYDHTSGSAPGGCMIAMAASWCQEFFGYDLRYALAVGCKETFLCLFYDSTYSESAKKWDWVGQVDNDPYQMLGGFAMRKGIQSMPDYFNHSLSYKEKELEIVVPDYYTKNIIHATINFSSIVSSVYYGYFSAARSLRLDEFVVSANDPFSTVRVVSCGYNLGSYLPAIWKLAYGSERESALNSFNLATDFGIVGGHNYTPHVIDLMRRIGRSAIVYDWGITWGDIADFLSDLRGEHYANGIPSEGQWEAMKSDMHSAFNRMKGHAPTDSLGAERISFRYNWLTMVRIMKRYLPKPRIYLPKGQAMNATTDFFDAYIPSGQCQETKPEVPDTNRAPEVYWISPQYTVPVISDSSFPPVEITYDSTVELIADILDDGTGGGALTVRYAVSPGDPAGSGYSYWLDGEKTGGSAANPVSRDWAAMTDIGASSAPPGGRRFSAVYTASGINNEKRRIYIEANDNCGYRTIAWVDVVLKENQTGIVVSGNGSALKDKNNSDLQAVPNPATIPDTVELSFGTRTFRKALFYIYDGTGNVVTKKKIIPGRNTILWDLRNTNGRQVSSGVYLALIKGVDSSGKTYLLKTYIAVKK